MKKQVGITRLIAAIVAAIVLAFPSGVVAAQSQDFAPDSYVSTLTGFEITITGSTFAITGATLEHYRTGEGEVVNIESEFAIAEVSFFDDEDTPDDSIDAYLGNLEAGADSFTIVDRSSKRDVYHAFATFTYDGVDMVIYAQVTEDVVDNVDLFEMLITTADEFESDLEDARDAILIDGSPFMEGVDGAALMTAATGSDDVSTPAVDGDTSISTNPRDGARIGDGQKSDTGDDPDTVDETPVVGTDADDVPGVLTDSSWIGPIFEHEIGWDVDAWSPDQSGDGAVYSSEEEMVDGITLYSDSWAVQPLIYVAVIDGAAHSPADYLEYWSSDDYIQEWLIGDNDGTSEILLSRSRTDGIAIVIQYTIDGDEYVRVNQMIDLGDGTLLMIQLDGAPDEIVDVFDSATQAITFDGEGLPTILTLRQIERAVGN